MHNTTRNAYRLNLTRSTFERIREIRAMSESEAAALHAEYNANRAYLFGDDQIIFAAIQKQLDRLDRKADAERARVAAYFARVASDPVFAAERRAIADANREAARAAFYATRRAA
jgi:glutathione S-transferase